jgi:hypothetical protein
LSFRNVAAKGRVEFQGVIFTKALSFEKSSIPAGLEISSNLFLGPVSLIESQSSWVTMVNCQFNQGLRVRNSDFEVFMLRGGLVNGDVGLDELRAGRGWLEDVVTIGNLDIGRATFGPSKDDLPSLFLFPKKVGGAVVLEGTRVRGSLETKKTIFDNAQRNGLQFDSISTN